tara:strand:+ start:8195 stop:8896 length:702 start_codon:yes stop_codon:yes gene_type:complete
MKSQKQILIESLKQKGFSKEILQGFSKVKRENFVPKEIKEYAYEDTSLPIGNKQTISQPYTIAMMFSLLELKKGLKILEIGSGCGYVLALLSEIVGRGNLSKRGQVKGEVYGIEIIKELSEKSKKNLKEYKNIKVYNKNGRLGLKEEVSAMSQNQRKVKRRKPWCPRFDRILISARNKEIPEKLVSQLKNNGIIVAPLGNSYVQSLTAFKKVKGKLKLKKEIPGFVFVPLVGD